MEPRHTVASGVLTRSGAAITIAMCLLVFRMTRLIMAMQRTSLLHFWLTVLVRSMWDRIYSLQLPLMCQ